MEVEDDVFFADLSKRMALLIMEDEEESPAQCPTLPVQELPCMPQMSMLPPHTHEVAYRRRGEQRNGSLHPTLCCTKKEEQAKEIHCSGGQQQPPEAASAGQICCSSGFSCHQCQSHLPTSVQ